MLFYKFNNYLWLEKHLNLIEFNTLAFAYYKKLITKRQLIKLILKRIGIMSNY